jgi:hypothetical protein
MHPSRQELSKRHQEHNLKHPGWMDPIITKQNKLPSFIDRRYIYGHEKMHVNLFFHTYIGG